jgi:hypothetical protein
MITLVLRRRSAKVGQPRVSIIAVTLNRNKWNTHIDNITSNGNKFVGYLVINLQISNPEVKSRAYQALLRPKLKYSWILFNQKYVCIRNVTILWSVDINR